MHLLIHFGAQKIRYCVVASAALHLALPRTVQRSGKVLGSLAHKKLPPP